MCHSSSNTIIFNSVIWMDLRILVGDEIEAKEKSDGEIGHHSAKMLIFAG